MFDVHMLNEAGIDKAHRLRNGFEELLIHLEKLCGPDGREMSIVRTKLQEASFFAKRAMALRPENQR
jgi:hypothetical protein